MASSLFNGLTGGGSSGNTQSSGQAHHDASFANHEHASLIQLLSDIRRDLVSQQGRLLPNLKLALTAGETVLQGGVIDDRKYLVR
jgi:hypothetical protein